MRVFWSWGILLGLLIPFSCDDSAPANRPDSGADVSGDADAAADADADVPLDCRERVVEDVMIPVGDGARLAATVARPAGSGCRVPAILVQTPYGKANFRAEFLDRTDADHPLFHSPDYAVVILDWRGFFGSASAPPATLQRGYGEDGYDVIAWIASQPWSDGAVGTWGVSALCRVQYQTAVTNPPALRAAVPIFCQNNYTYLETYPGGVIRREYMQFLSAYFGASLYEAHPVRDAWWAWAERLYPVEDVRIPMLVVAGAFDLYNTGTLDTFTALCARSGDRRAEHRLLLGPWHHYASGGESTGTRPLNEQEMKYFDSTREIEKWSLRFFDFHLRGKSASRWEKAVVFRTANAQSWEEADNWPPPEAREQEWGVSADGALVEGTGTAGEITLADNPLDPSPTVGGQTLLSTYDHGPAWQDAVVSRMDAVVFATAPLAAPLRLSGPVRVELRASTSGVDADVAVRLTDVDADGRHLLITDGIARLSMPPPYASRMLPVPGVPVPVTVNLTNHAAWTLPAGHRLGIIVSGSNYARFDANPHDGAAFFTGTGVPANLTLHLDSGARLVVTASP